MKVITTNLLNYFWKNGVKPIKDAVGSKLDASKVANNLTTTVAGYALDARQGRELNNNKLSVTNVANNLATTQAGYALDARQGKALEDKIAALNGKLSVFIAWREGFIGSRCYRFSFGKIHNGYLRSNQIQIPWTSSEVSVTLTKINIPGLAVLRTDYKTASITAEGGLYIQCSTKGAIDADNLANQVAECDITITKK